MNQLLERYVALEVCKRDIEKAVDAIEKVYRAGGKLLLCGNGGSCADCEHISGELMKGFLKKRPLVDEKKREMRANCPEIDEAVLDKLQDALPAIPLTSLTALNSAFCNDVAPDLIYAQGVLALGKKGDALIAMSTSGNSKNVVEAAKVAKALGMCVIALTGKCGGKLCEVADVCICAPECETFKVQELHLPIYHYICAEIEARFFSE